MTNSKCPLVLVDGSSYLYRAFFASQQADLRSADGTPTGAVRVMTSMLRSLLKQYPASPVVVVFDAKGKTFRDDIYPEYKAQRPPMPDDLRSQVEPIHNIIRAMGLPLVMYEGVEADDVIGTLAREATEKSCPMLISTGDKDMAQLVNEHVTLINTMTDTLMDVEGVKEKFGIPPELIIDYLALMGDKVDNIPGVPGVGEKTALALLQGIGSIEALYQNLDQIADLGFRGSKTMAKKLEDNREAAELSYLLATIKLDVEITESIDDFTLPKRDVEALSALFEHYEFRSWSKELAAGNGNTRSEAVPSSASAAELPTTTLTSSVVGEVNYQAIITLDELNLYLGELQQANLLAFDIITTPGNYMEAEIIGISLSCVAGISVYIPFGHDYIGAPEQLNRAFVLEKLKAIFQSEHCVKVAQHLKYKMTVLAHYGVHFKGGAYDVLLESYVHNSTASKHELDLLAGKYLEHTTTTLEEIAGKGKKQLAFSQLELEQAMPYAAEQVDICLRLHHCMQQHLSGESELLTLLHDIEMPLVPVLSKIERNGALLDSNLLGKQSIELADRLAELEKQAFVAADKEFNLSSPKQLQQILFEEQGLPVIKKTPKGAPSTAEEVLVELSHDYPLPKLILEHRSLSKLKSTYTDKLPLMVNPSNQRVHTSYHQSITATGRLSSSDPNLQNIPVRTAEGRRIREAFVAPTGFKLVAADYSQIELRIMAHLSADEGLLTAFKQGGDVHRATAAEVFKVDAAEVTTDQRRSAKAINFGLIYGMSAFGLAKQLGVGRKEAQSYIDHYFETYPGVQRYMDDIRIQASEHGYVETLFGRRLYLPDIKARNAIRRQAAERTAINAPMQGTAADIIKRAMITVDQWLPKAYPQVRMIMQVHDELVFEVPEDQVKHFTAEVCQQMASAAELDVPLLVEAGVGDNWEQAH